MADNRLKREHETREKDMAKRSWEAPDILPMPDPQPGWAFRWVRISTLGEIDARNISSKFREGWEPCLATDHPEITLVTIENDRFKDNIVIGGLLLCKMPQEMQDERKQYYRQVTQNQMAAVDNNLMRENDPRMPIFNDRKSSVSFGKGS